MTLQDLERRTNVVPKRFGVGGGMYKGKEPVRERPELAEDDLRGSDRTFNLPTLAPELWVARHPGDGLRAPAGAHESP